LAVGSTAEIESWTHIEIDVGDTHENKSIPVESIQIRTGGSLSFSHAVSLN
jgi:hypothetical protein